MAKAQKLEETLALLSQGWQRTRTSELCRAALLTIAMFRHDEALAFLHSLIEAGQ
jgi:hypothetical protein